MRLVALMGVFVGLSAWLLSQESRTRAGTASSTATFHCIGMEWPIQGDANHNATCTVWYRVQGETAWQQGMPLLRCDTEKHNSFAGSLFFLRPGTAYEVRLQLHDPDGGDQNVTLKVPTRPLPAFPSGQRVFHVVPGSGGGDGSAARPFRGLATAEGAAQPGDTFLLHAGRYGFFTFDRSGAPGKPIAWKGEGVATLAGASIKGSHLWFEGLTFRRENPADEDGVKGEGASEVVFLRNHVIGFHNGVVLERGSNRWYIADNVIEGDNDPIAGSLSGEGIELNVSHEHVVAYNRITRVADGISYPGRECDLYGNHIQDVSDDGIETDRGQTNTRVWGNRIVNACNNVFSFQPMGQGPWYFIRNEVVLTRGKVWKFVQGVEDRFVALHNTFVFPTWASEYAQCFLNSFCRNNLYIAYRAEQPIWRAAWNRRRGGPGRTTRADWMTDVDYDGFDWDDKPVPFLWFDLPCRNLGSLTEAAGIERHGLRVKKEEIFEQWTLPSAQENAPPLNLQLKTGSDAVDAGAVVPNINEDFMGKGPDLGALELGRPRPHYGPRMAAQ